MPRITADAPDLAISPDGAWLARLDGGFLRLYDLRDVSDGALEEPVMTLEQPGAMDPAHVGFCAADRLLCLHGYQQRDDDEEGVLAALLDVPTLESLSRIVVPGACRVLGIGAGGAVVAPNSAGADVVTVRGTELSLDQTFLRGDVLSAAPAPARRWLIEQRSGHELWDAASRRITARLTLSTRQPLQQVGFAEGGKLIWTLAAGVPVHLEFFRFSDGRRLYELDEPGRPLRADAGAGRLLVAIAGEGHAVRFLDIDLGNQGLRRITAPPGPLLAFALRPTAAAPEIIALVGGDVPMLHRVPLEQLLMQDEPQEAQRGRSQGEPARREAGRVSPFMTRERGEDAAPSAPSAIERQRLLRTGEIRRTPLRRAAEESRPQRHRPRDFPTPELAPPPELEDEEAPSPEPPMERLGLGRPLRRAPDAPQGPGAWHWELLRWAQLLLTESEEDLSPTPPSGGPLQALGTRLSLSPIAQKVAALLYALERLAGTHPDGLTPLEITQLLGVIHDEAQVLTEVLPDSPLHRLGVLGRGSRGRLRLRPAAAALFDGTPVMGLSPGTSHRPGGQRLEAALYLTSQYAGPCLAAISAAANQPVLRIDALGEDDPLAALARALIRAKLHGAAVLIDGLPGVSYPVFSGDGKARALRRLLHAPQVPLIVAGSSQTLAGLGLSGRHLPVALPPAESPAPVLPSVPLPQGTLFRPPRPGGRAVFLDGAAPVPGRLEPLTSGDPRAAIVLGPTATPDDYSRAAAIAARDGAALALDSPLSPARAAVLAVLLRQIPAMVLIPPPPDGLPPELAHLVE